MSMHAVPLTPTEEAGFRAHGLQRHIGKPSQLADVFRQGIAWGEAAERKAFADELAAEMTLDGFGCACEPRKQCGTCHARDVLTKALSPMLRRLRA